MKNLTYEYLSTLDSSILHRMLNCESYYNSLDIDTQCDIYEVLYERYCVGVFEGYLV